MTRIADTFGDRHGGVWYLDSLWFGSAPALNQEGTGHIKSGNSQWASRDWTTPVDVNTTDLYFAALIRISGTNAQTRFEFYDTAGASGNMRMNVGPGAQMGVQCDRCGTGGRRYLMEVQLEHLPLESFQALEDRDGLFAILQQHATDTAE